MIQCWKNSSLFFPNSFPYPNSHIVWANSVSQFGHVWLFGVWLLWVSTVFRNLPSQWTSRVPLISFPRTLYWNLSGEHCPSVLITKHRWQLKSFLQVLNKFDNKESYLWLVSKIFGSKAKTFVHQNRVRVWQVDLAVFTETNRQPEHLNPQAWELSFKPLS